MKKDPELVRALDYILNHSNEASIEVLSEAIVRRRRDLTIFQATGSTPDPRRMASEITEQINAGVGGGIETMKKSVREMIVRIIKENAPELTAAQIDELSEAWLPEQSGKKEKDAVPRDMLVSMVDQFISFSRGEMKPSVDKKLRDEMGEWPKKYWNAFSPVIRSIISDFLKERISEKEFNSKIGIALEI